MDDDDREIAREMASINAWSRVHDMRNEAEELAQLVRSCQPGLQAVEGLSDDMKESRFELLLWYLGQRGRMRRVIELLAG